MTPERSCTQSRNGWRIRQKRLRSSRDGRIRGELKRILNGCGAPFT